MDPMVLKFALFGGLLMTLGMVHVWIDFFFQSHNEAMAKSHDWVVRWRHCEIYTVPFVPLMRYGFHMSVLATFVCAAILFFSHFFEDTYYPVFLWVKHVRKPPQFQPGNYFDPGHGTVGPKPDLERFKDYVSTPIGLLLMIVADQWVHFFFLGVIAWMALR